MLFGDKPLRWSFSPQKLGQSRTCAVWTKKKQQERFEKALNTVTLVRVHCLLSAHSPAVCIVRDPRLP